jgi:hypothetical protein
MKAWQRLDQKQKVTGKPEDPAQMMGHMFHSFALHAKFWRAVGSRRRGVCQFSLQGAEHADWFVAIDETGARVATGKHPAPTVRWRSEAAVFTKLMRGEGGPELVDHGQVAIDGDLALIDQLFRGLSAKL